MANGTIQSLNAWLYTKKITHTYSVAAGQSVSWNASTDSGFYVTGYTPIGIITYKTNAAEVFVVNLSVADGYGIYLRNISSSAAVNNRDFEYTVLYIKN